MTVSTADIRRELLRRVLAQRGVDPEVELARLRQQAAQAPLHERTTLHEYLRELLPASFPAAMAPAHEEMWRWARTIRPGQPVPAFVGVWPRGYGKSTNGEGVVIDVLARRARSYVMIVRATQTMANESVLNIGKKLRSYSVRTHYPHLAGGRTTMTGKEANWNAQRLLLPHATVDAMGLDTARRGSKVEDDRPDFLIFDDIDGAHDSPEVTEKKIITITETILPMLAENGTVLVLQNLITAHGVVAQLAGVTDPPAAFLANRIVSGPVPAVRDLQVQPYTLPDGRMGTRISGGVPTWPEGMSLTRCQQELDNSSYDAWLREKQNEVQKRKGALWTAELLAATRVDRVPELLFVVVGVDPSADVGQPGIIVVGGAWLGADGVPAQENAPGAALHTYTLADYTPAPGSSPAVWGEAAVRAYYEWDADEIVGEVNNGGDMVGHTVRTVPPTTEHDGGAGVAFVNVRASRGKITRAVPVSSRMEQGLDHHAGVFTELEKQLKTYVATDKVSPDRMDAKVWATVRVVQRLGGERRKRDGAGGPAVPRLGKVQGDEKVNVFSAGRTPNR